MLTAQNRGLTAKVRHLLAIINMIAINGDLVITIDSQTITANIILNNKWKKLPQKECFLDILIKSMIWLL